MSPYRTKDAAESPDAVLPEPVPRGVATTDHNRGFFAGLDNTIQAVDLETGQLAWTVDIPGQPILAAEGKVMVVTQSPSRNLSLLVLDENSGEELSRCELPLALNADTSSIDEQFEIRPSMAEDRLHVQWKMHTPYKGGAPPPQYVKQSADEILSGAFDCELHSGEIIPTLAAAAVDRPRRQSWPYRLNGVWQKTSWISNQEENVLELRRTDASRDLLLTSFSATDGSNVRSTVLASTDAVEPTLTPDGKFLFVRQTVPADEHWTVWQVADHTPVGKLKYQPGAEFPTVLDDTVYFLTQSSGPSYRMHAVRLPDGDELWNLELDAGPAQKVAPPPPRMP